jgi:hypothetical protein
MEKKVIPMKVDSYEPFHIGSKIIYYVDRRILINKIYNYYEEKNKEENNIFDLNKEIVEREVVISPKINIVTNKENKTNVQMNYVSDALNVTGTEPPYVYEIFEDLMGKLPSLGFELESTFAYYEVISSVILLIEKDAKDIFDKFSPNLFSEIDYIPEIRVNYIKFSDSFIEGANQERFQLEVLPNRTSPTKRLILRILNRFFKLEEVKPFIDNFNNLINDIYHKLGDE